MDAFERAMRHHQRRSYSEATPPYQRERLQHLQRIARAVLGTVDVRIERSSIGVLTLRGATLGNLLGEFCPKFLEMSHATRALPSGYPLRHIRS